MKPLVSIIILNWNGWEDTLECLESVYQNAYPNYLVIVADNDSTNESIKKILEYSQGKSRIQSPFFTYNENNKPITVVEYSRQLAESGGGKEKLILNLPSNKRLVLIKNEKNFGFAEGNNIAIRYALTSLNSDYILLLNNDTVVDKTFLNEMINAAEKEGKIGFVGPKVYYYSYDGQKNVFHSAGATINMKRAISRAIGSREVDYGQYNEKRIVDYLEGACLLVKKNVITEIGLLDPIYFLYWEETDWCTRAKKYGYDNKYIPGAKIWHKIKNLRDDKKNIYFKIRNRFLFMHRYADRKQIIIFLIYFFIFDFWHRIAVIILFYRDMSGLVPYFKGVYDGLKIISEK